MRKRNLSQMVRAGMDPDDIDEELEDENAGLRVQMSKRPRGRGTDVGGRVREADAVRDVSRRERKRRRDEESAG